MTEFKTVSAAEELLASATRDTWSLADAILSDVPSVPPSEKIRQANHVGTLAGVNVIDLLDLIAETLIERGTTTPNGDPYSTVSLEKLRETAMRWPLGERHQEAAYRTHQEAGGRDGGGRRALAALCAVARGQLVDCPAGLDAVAWGNACARVRDKRNRNRPPRFLVAANDLRVALERSSNTPAPTKTASISGVLHHLTSAAESLGAFAIAWADLEVDESDCVALRQTLKSLIARAEQVLDVVETKFDDADLAQLIEEESR